MELKPYQKQTLNDIEEYLTIFRSEAEPASAFNIFWANRGGFVKETYDDSIRGVPRFCIKVPTGGGKTAIGVSSIRRFFKIFPRRDMAVVWLVPSDAILTQTLAAFRNPDHPYRQRLNEDFYGRVEIVDVESALRGESFRHGSDSGQLTVYVLSYDSLRTRNANNRRMYRENGNMIDSGLSLKYPSSPISGADPNSVIVGLYDLSPYIVLDESHNARSPLSKEMLASLNPSAILEMTATPRRGSNVITYVTASELKRNQMVKLPIILYGRYDKNDVLTTAKAIRDGLERKAKVEESEGGNYIRPIVLCQAQPRSMDDSETFDKVRRSLMSLGIPEDQIAVKVSGHDEIKDIDLMSRDCEIRYIITVNALKEGWDCPFAYILATIADRKSPVDVQQIVGRVLRQPYAMRCRNPVLNESFIITCSQNFSDAVRSVTESLKDEGFGKRSLRLEQGSIYMEPPIDGEDDDDPVVPTEDTAKDAPAEPDTIGEDDDALPDPTDIPTAEEVEDILQDAADAEEDALGRTDSKDEIETERVREINNSGSIEFFDRSTVIREEFRDEVRKLRIPVFEIRSRDKRDLEGNPVYEALSFHHLYHGVDASKFDIKVNFSLTGSTMAKADAKGDDIEVDYTNRQERLDFFFDFNGVSKPGATLLNICVNQISARLDAYANPCLDLASIRKCVSGVLEDCDSDTLETISRNIGSATRLFQDQFAIHLARYRRAMFREFTQNSDFIICGTHPGYSFPEKLTVYNQSPVNLSGSLYEKEEAVTGWEFDLLQTIMGSSNVRWWHRINPSRKSDDFHINGYLHHYPDFIVMTNRGTLVLIEGKGPHLDGRDSEEKLELGRTWAMMANCGFVYLMVFPDSEVRLENAVYLSQLQDRLNQL